jgi:hypothetical protein
MIDTQKCVSFSFAVNHVMESGFSLHYENRIDLLRTVVCSALGQVQIRYV